MGLDLASYILLLLVHMPNLEEDVGLIQRTGRIICDPLETLRSISFSTMRGKRSADLKTLSKFHLLLVDDAQTKVDFISFLKIGCHAHDLRESFFGMIERTISIVKDPDAIP